MSSRPLLQPRPPRRSVQAPADPAHDCALTVLASVPELMREIRAAMRRAAPEGLTVPQFRALLFAQRQPDGGVGDLAAHLGVTLPTASVTVSNLARRGLLAVVSPEGDKRRRAIRLTPAGTRVVDTAWVQTAADFAQRLGALSAAELNPLRQALTALTACLNTLP